MHVEQSERIVISESDLWRPIEDRSSVLEQEDRSGLCWRRLFASLLDGLLLLVPMIIVVAMVGIGGGLVATAIGLSYDFLCEALTGQTAGKAALGIRVVRKDGGPLHLAAVATRNVLRFVDATLIGPICVLATRGRQRLGDMVAGTVVTRAGGLRHIPSSERYRAAVLVAYPATWVGAAIVVAVLAAGQAKSADYRRLASLTCVQARAASNATTDADIAEAHRTAVDVERALRLLDPPSSMAAAHGRLVTAVHSERALLGRAAHLHGPARQRAAQAYQVLVRHNAAQARADGFLGCG